MDDGLIDAIVTDPPYELGFMGKAWDASGVAYSVGLWAEVLRVLKPGGHLLAFGGTRTYHRMTVAIEDAGFEVRDSIHWVYGSGFPKSLDVSKAIDKAAGAEREVIGDKAWNNSAANFVPGEDHSQRIQLPITAPATDAARQWDGWGTALKPAHEPIVVARKPLAGTVAANVLEYGTGALNIDGCRVAAPDGVPQFEQKGQQSVGVHGDGLHGSLSLGVRDYSTGRWPANFVLTHAADCGDDCAPGCPVAALDEQSGDGASRFFTVTEWDDAPFRYVAKPSRAERNAGTDRNIHPTVKPLDLMRWLVRLVTPPGGVVLDLFAGSGTTLASAILEGFDCVGVEMTDDYLPLIEGRCTWAEKAARFGPVTGRPKVDADDTPTLFDVEDDK
jgi:site-specific DNA-methyltransferase (adenine-specific)